MPTSLPAIGPTRLAPFVDEGARRVRFEVPAPAPAELPEVIGVLAGAAEADLTPPPGLPKAGYSANAHDGNGFRTRLRARVTHLRAGRSSIALVQCDLLSGSSVLQYLVAEAIAERTDIGLAGVWIGATHTHAGPGQFLGTDLYNRHASNRPGFDPAWTDFLVRQIAGAVIEAHDTRGPAAVAFGSTEVWGLTRNRSHDPHVQNRTVTDKRLDPQRKWVAINPLLHLLRVDRRLDDGSSEPLSAAAIFSIHGTGIPMQVHEYNADIWAYLVGELRHRIHDAHGIAPVVGASEGTHADMAPALRPGLAGHREARRVGTAIGREAAVLYERLGSELRDDVELACALREVDLDRAAARRVGDVELPDRPAMGAALIAGATENVTPIVHRIPPFAPGHPRRWGRPGPHGPKWVIGSRYLQGLVHPKRHFPRRLSVQLLRIGDAALVGLPFEITVESGRRIARAVERAVGEAGPTEVVVSSLVNEYWGYVATEEEYGRQYYEGGHTIYGANTERFLSAQAARLATDAGRRPVFLDVADRRWDLRARRYLVRPPAPGTPTPERRFLGRAVFADPTLRDDAVWEQCWIDVAPGGLHWHEPMVRVEASDDDGATWVPAAHGWRAADDQGWALEVTHLGEAAGGRGGAPDGAGGAAGSGAHRYRVRWHDPDHRFGRRHRFVLLANAGRPEVAGPPFD